MHDDVHSFVAQRSLTLCMWPSLHCARTRVHDDEKRERRRRFWRTRIHIYLIHTNLLALTHPLREKRCSMWWRGTKSSRHHHRRRAHRIQCSACRMHSMQRAWRIERCDDIIYIWLYLLHSLYNYKCYFVWKIFFFSI